MNKKQRVFVEEYLQCWNATEAAERAGYAHPNKQGPRLLVNVGISDVIQKRISEKAMSADEVLLRLGDMARGDIGDFLSIGGMSFDLSLKQAQELGITHLIKRVKQRTIITQKKDGDEEENHYIEIELHDSQAALEKLGRHHKLFTDRQEIIGDMKITHKDDKEIDRAISTLAETIGERIHSENGG